MLVKNEIFSPLAIQTEKQQAGKVGGKPSFADTFRKAINDVNNLQVEAESLNQQLVNGQVDDLHQVILAGEKAELSLQLTLQIRNKLIEAYQEIMRMQV